jgi:tight adherence protein B
LTVFEVLLFAVGTALLARFALMALAPYFRNRMEATAHKRARDLKEEFLLLPPRKILMALLASGISASAIVLVATANVFWTAFSFIVPIVLSGFAVRYFRRNRRKKVISQLPGFLDVLAGQIKAGHSFQEALSDTIPLLPREIRKEISWVFQLCRLGTPLAEALLSWEERMPCEEISLLVRPLRVALPAGGNIVDLLLQSRDILRTRNRMEEKMRSMTAQARLQASVLTLLPPVFVAVLSKVDPDFLPRCTGTVQGKGILAIAGFLQLLGWLTIRKILSVKP